MYNSKNKNCDCIKNYTAVIQAGGKGTRMTELTNDMIPKPMLVLNGKPMIQWQIENVRKYGIIDFVIITGHLGEKIQEYFGDGSEFGVHIQYIMEKEPLGSAGSLYFLKFKPIHKNFLLIFGDVMFDIDWNRMITFHEEKKGMASLLMHPNTHPWDSDLIVADEEQCVTDINSKRDIREQMYDNCVNAGLYILSGTILQEIQKSERIDLELDLLKPLIRKRQVFGYRTSEYVKDAGTVSRFYSVCEEQKQGIWEKRNLGNRQKCIFFNGNVLSGKDNFEIKGNVIEAVRLLNASEILVIGCFEKYLNLENSHKKVQAVMGEQGVYLDDIVLNTPLPEAMLKMAVKYNVELSYSYFIGNNPEDVQNGTKIGIRTVLYAEGFNTFSDRDKEQPDFIARNLLETVRLILNETSIKV